jgi:HSP20 family protein
MFDQYQISDGATYDERAFTPVTDLIETDESYLLSVDLPGIKKEDIKIEVVENTIVISGERQVQKRTENEKFQHSEKNYGYFKRSFSLPKSVDANAIQALHQDGVLEVTLPKTQEVKIKKIEVK